MSNRRLPAMRKFDDEAEEARWIDEHRDELSEDILSAVKNGTLGEGSLARAERKQKEAELLRSPAA